MATETMMNPISGQGGVPIISKDPENVRRFPDGTFMRPDDIFKEDLQEAMMKNKEDMNDAEIMAVEREIRKFVSKKGGWTQGIPDADMKKGTFLLDKLGRNHDRPKWDMSIVIQDYLK